MMMDGAERYAESIERRQHFDASRLHSDLSLRQSKRGKRTLECMHVRDSRRGMRFKTMTSQEAGISRLGKVIDGETSSQAK
jgi:hypothetical protein